MYQSEKYKIELKKRLRTLQVETNEDKRKNIIPKIQIQNLNKNRQYKYNCKTERSFHSRIKKLKEAPIKIIEIPKRSKSITNFKANENIEINLKIKNLEKKMNEKINNDIIKLNTEIVGIKTDMKDLVDGVKTEITNLKNEVSGVKSEITDLKKEVSGVKSEITDLKKEVKEEIKNLAETFKNSFNHFEEIIKGIFIGKSQIQEGVKKLFIYSKQNDFQLNK